MKLNILLLLLPSQISMGQHGLIGSCYFGENKKKNTLFIDTWIMSCRVLKEENGAILMLDEIVNYAKKDQVH